MNDLHLYGDIQTGECLIYTRLAWNTGGLSALP